MHTTCTTCTSTCTVTERNRTQNATRPGLCAQRPLNILTTLTGQKFAGLQQGSEGVLAITHLARLVPHPNPQPLHCSWGMHRHAHSESNMNAATWPLLNVKHWTSASHTIRRFLTSLSSRDSHQCTPRGLTTHERRGRARNHSTLAYEMPMDMSTI